MLSELGLAIAKQESDWDYDPNEKMAVAERLNNPGNLIYAGQRGATPFPVVGADGKTRVFAKWNTKEEGEAGLERQLRVDALRGHTIKSLARKWLGGSPLPTAEGNPTVYAVNIAARLKVPVDTPIAQVWPSKETPLIRG